MSSAHHLAAFGLLLVTSVGCGFDRLDHEGGCPDKVLPADFDGNDIELLKGYTRIGGDLTIPEGTTELSALRCLEVIDGVLSIDALPELETLDGLENLRAAGSVGLYDLPALESTRGLSGLRETEGLSLVALPSLRTIEAPSEVEGLDGSWIRASSLPALELWEPPIGATTLERIELESVAPGALVTAFAEVEHVHAIWVHTSGEASDGVRLRLDALASVDDMTLDPVGQEGIDSLGVLTEVGKLALTRFPGDSLAGLAALRSLETLEIAGARNLRSLAGLESLEQLTDLYVSDAPVLENLDGLSGVRQMPVLTMSRQHEGPLEPEIALSDCPALVDITGLASVQNDYMYRFALEDVPSLTEPGVWPTLRQVGNLRLSNTGLHDLDAFAGLTRLSSQIINADGTLLDTASFGLALENNPHLVDLDGLDPARGAALAAVGEYADITVQDNPQLSACAAEGLVASLEALGRVHGPTEVSGNDGTAPCE